MKVISGKYKGREVKSPREAGTHPMGEREKLAVFNMILADLPGAAVLDAYAGSGALGIEAASRGAVSIVFVEKSPGVAKVIRENLRGLRGGWSENGDGLDDLKVICGDVKNVTFDDEFDVILADPPYDRFNSSEIENLTKFLKDGGKLVLSHPGEAPELAGLALEKSRQYARAHISIYTK